MKKANGELLSENLPVHNHIALHLLLRRFHMSQTNPLVQMPARKK